MKTILLIISTLILIECTNDEPTNAEKLCGKAETCHNIRMWVEYDMCVYKINQALYNLPVSCGECIHKLSCYGLERMVTDYQGGAGSSIECNICPGCCPNQ